MPEYTQTRMIYGQQQGLANNRQLLMSPSIPALEAAMFVTDVLSQGPLPILQEKANQLLGPSGKLIMGKKDEKYKGKRINAEYVSALKINADSHDPQPIHFVVVHSTDKCIHLHCQLRHVLQTLVLFHH